MNGLVVVDLIFPIRIIKKAQYFDCGHDIDVDVISNIAYVVDGNNGLQIIELLI